MRIYGPVDVKSSWGRARASRTGRRATDGGSLRAAMVAGFVAARVSAAMSAQSSSFKSVSALKRFSKSLSKLESSLDCDTGSVFGTRRWKVASLEFQLVLGRVMPGPAGYRVIFSILKHEIHRALASMCNDKGLRFDSSVSTFKSCSVHSAYASLSRRPLNRSYHAMV